MSAFVNRYCRIDPRTYSLSHVRVFRRTRTDEQNFFWPARSLFNSALNRNTSCVQAMFVPIDFKATNPGQEFLFDKSCAFYKVIWPRHRPFRPA